MKKILMYMLFLAGMPFLWNACSNEDEKNPEKPTFNVETARSAFESTARDLTLPGNAFIPLEGTTRSAAEGIVLIPMWDLALTFEECDALEVPLQTENILMASVKRGRRGKEPSHKMEEVHSRLVFTQNPMTGEIEYVVVTFISEKRFSAARGLDVSQVSSTGTGSKFSGMIFHSTTEGELLAGSKYLNGEKTHVMGGFHYHSGEEADKEGAGHIAEPDSKELYTNIAYAFQTLSTRDDHTDEDWCRFCQQSSGHQSWCIYWVCPTCGNGTFVCSCGETVPGGGDEDGKPGNPNPSPNPGGPVTIEVNSKTFETGLTYIFSYSTDIDVARTEWEINDGSTEWFLTDNGTRIWVTFRSAGTRTVRCRVYDKEDTASAWASLSVSVTERNLDLASPHDRLIYVELPSVYHNLVNESDPSVWNSASTFPYMFKIDGYTHANQETLCLAGTGKIVMEYGFINFNTFDTRFDLSKFSFYWGDCGPAGGTPEMSIYVYNGNRRGWEPGDESNTEMLDDGGGINLAFVFDNIFRTDSGSVTPNLTEGRIFGKESELKLLYDGIPVSNFVHPELSFDIDHLDQTVFYTGPVKIRYIYSSQNAGKFYGEVTNVFDYDIRRVLN